MTPTGEAPAASEFMFAYGGDNYAVEKDDLISGSNDDIYILDSAGNNVATLTGLAQSFVPTDPIEVRGTNGVSFWICGCEDPNP